VVTTFAWDWATPVPEVLSSGATRYLLGAETLGQWDGAAWAYYLPDALGSVRQTVDRAGAVTAAREWSPYGEEIGGAQAGLGYTGEWQDVDVGLVYLRARWYQAQTGRFSSRDQWTGEIWEPISLHAYLYAANNPLHFIDPSGQVYITFDDGPKVGIDDKILDTLKTFNAHATFFFTGQNIDLNNDAVVEIVWRVATEGHRLGNHSYSHLTYNETGMDMTLMCWGEVLAYLGDTETVIRQALRQVKNEHPYRYYMLPPNVQYYVDQVITKGTGLFRPPGGAITTDQREQLSCHEPFWGETICPPGIENPYGVYKWDVDPRDWAISTAYDRQYLTYEEETAMLLDRLQHGWNKNGILGKVLKTLGPSGFGSLGVTSNEDIILLHSSSKITVDTLDEIMKWLQTANYTFDVLKPGWEN